MEWMARLFRAVGNCERIRILRVLTVLGETRVCELVRGLSRVQGRVSTDLGVLATSGVVWMRRSGRAVHYRMAEAPSHPVTQEAVRFVGAVFGDVRARDIARVAAADQGDSALRSDAALVAFFRGFTPPRRLQIIRYLSTNGAAHADHLVEALSMSPQACIRHVANLRERGIVKVERARGGGQYALATLKDASRRQLVTRIVTSLQESGD